MRFSVAQHQRNVARAEKMAKSHGMIVPPCWLPGNDDRYVFDWRAVLLGFLSERPDSLELEEATSFSGAWISCACGQLDDRLKRDKDGVPEDKELRDLGVRFYMQVEEANFAGALGTLDQIEARERELLS